MRRKNQYVSIGLTVFLTAAAILLFYDTLFGSHVLPGIAGQFLGAFSPILTGAFMAYLLAPAVNFLEDRFFSTSVQKARAEGKFCAKGVRWVSVALVWLMVSVLVYLLLSVLLPELYKSVMQLAGNLENYYNTIYAWVQGMFDRYPELEGWLADRLKEAYNSIETYIQGVLSSVQTIMAAAGRGMVGVMNFLKNLLIGIIVSIYLMTTKEHFSASAKKTTYSLFSRKDVDWMLRAVRKADSIFSGFVRGKLLDSFIIGILCFIGASILQFPYTPLVSVFVGITNIIPFFGPFIGAVPSAFLILLVSPMKALYFVVFILALQQLDGNIIGPKILGGQTGLSSLLVIVAILIGGSFFGIPGMFFGVPVFACLYSAGQFFVEERLKNSGLPSNLMAYHGDADPRNGTGGGKRPGHSEHSAPAAEPADTEEAAKPETESVSTSAGNGAEKKPLEVKFLRRNPLKIKMR